MKRPREGGRGEPLRPRLDERGSNVGCRGAWLCGVARWVTIQGLELCTEQVRLPAEATDHSIVGASPPA